MEIFLFQGGYRDEALLIELVTLVGLEGLLARCGGLDGQLDQVTNFYRTRVRSLGMLVSDSLTH